MTRAQQQVPIDSKSRLTAELVGWIGREVVYQAPEPLGLNAIRYFALAIGDDCPLYTDAETASRSLHAGTVAPPTLVCETNQFYRRPADANGYIGHTWDLPLESSAFIRGGNEYEFVQPVRPDDVVTITWRLAEIFERQGQHGKLLLFVVSEARYSNQRAELLAVNRETNIYL